MAMTVLELMLLASTGADLVTTEIALSRGLAEGNVAMQNRAVRVTRCCYAAI